MFSLLMVLTNPKVFFLLILLYAIVRLILLPGVTLIPREPLPTGISWLWTYRANYWHSTLRMLKKLKLMSKAGVHFEKSPSSVA
ncbi:MAG TPA: hypothetical protein VH186_36415 [Chloroflexia bacterium]|nr:hypothetical protein [Chloroflexia bacterium]